MSEQTYVEAERGPGYWAMAVVALLLILFGIPILAGGIWLIGLGGSWYYAIAGIGLIGSGALMLRRSMAGFWLYLATYLFTIIWAFWEVGTDWWAQVPRLVAPTVMMIAVLACIPALGVRHVRRIRRDNSQAGVVAAGLLFGITMGMIGVVQVALAPTARAQEAPAAADTATQDGATTPAANEETAAPVLADTTGVTVAANEPEQTLEAGADWPYWGGDENASRYSSLDQITADNVGDLERAWVYHTGDMPSEKAQGKYSPEITPIAIGGNLYMCSAMNVLISVDAATGEERWRYDPEVSTESIPYGATCRGVAFYRNPEAAADEVCAARVVEATLDARLIEVDAETGEPCANFGENGSVDLNEGIWKNDEVIPGWYAVTAPPVIVRGVVVTGAQVSDGEAEDAPSGVIRGYDAVTGELAWAWDLANPDLTGAPPQGEIYTRGTPNMWTTAVADEQLGYVYVPLGNSAVDYYGGNRSDAENEFSTSLVALDATTGEPVWHFQTVHYDVWDYDLGSQATLVDFPEDGGTVPAIILPSKQGDIYVLNRETGESLFPVEEMDAPTGGVEPENISPTQPVSSYATLRKPDLTEKDMWGATPLDQLWCRIQFRRAAYDGIYTPPTVDRHWIQYPGYNGGSDWGSVAVDPERGLIIANYNDMPNHNRLLTREEADKRNLRTIVQKYEDPESGQSGGAEGEGDPQAGSPYAIDVNAGWRVPLTGMLCKEPPYGWIRAIDLKTGETVWDEPLGSARQNGPFGIPSMLPLTIGTPNNGGSVVTAGGVIFVAATTDNMIRAIDEKTGKVLWEDTLPGGGQANPMTYEVDGRQYLVIAPGGHHFMETPISDAVIAYALPQSAG